MTVEEVEIKKQRDISNDSGNSSGSILTGNESISTSFESNETRNLIVNYLPQHMNETEVYTLFSTVGELESCKLVRSKETKQSLGYAFVKYKNHECAAEAVQKLNRITLANKTIKVSFARPSKPEIKDANLYVGGLPNGCTAEQLKKLFENFGDIITCRVVQADNSNDYYFGFVRFDTKKEATLAMEALHGKIPDKEIFPNCFTPLTVKFAKTPQIEINNMIPNNLIYETTNQWKTTTTGTTDDIARVYGRAHVQYLSSILNARESDEKDIFQGKSLSDNGATYMPKNYSNCSCCPAIQSSSSSSSSIINLVLTNLPPDASELMLYRLCSKYGPINSVQVFFEENNCFGIIEMLSNAGASQAVNSLNGLLLQPYIPLKAELY